MKIMPAVKSRSRCIKKFRHYFPKGYRDAKYIAWERDYKWQAHLAWEAGLNRKRYEELLSEKNYAEICKTAVNLESRTNLLFSFEKMALRDAVKSASGAKQFALGLFDYVYGKAPLLERFGRFTEVLGELPRKQTRVLTWPLHTVFGFIANPKEHIFLKPRVTQIASEKYDYAFNYVSKPNWNTYQDLLNFAEQIKKDTKDLGPRDYIDLQSFIWVMGSEEYPE